jgi:predicted DNA-binding transcriptional regulator YafY
MATNKHATIRYQTLDKCFGNPGRKYFIGDLIAACNQSINEFTGMDSGVKRRQIFEDIKFMKSHQGWNIPLEHHREGHRVFYRYSDKSFSINSQPLNETEENQLKEALLTLSRFKGMPQFEWVDEINARLDTGFGLSNSSEKFIEFEQNYYLQGLQYLTPIYNAILYKNVISIEYKSFKQAIPQIIDLHPYFLKQFNNRWYVFGKNDQYQYLMNLSLDRILGITDNSKAKFIPNETIDFTEHFEDIVGVTLHNEEEIQHVVIEISNNLFPYIQTKPIHGSQKIKEKSENVTLISLDLIPNYELESLILSHGEGMNVLEPISLREKIKQRVELMNKGYND